MNAKIWVQLESEEGDNVPSRGGEQGEKNYYIVYYVHNSIIENVYEGKKESSHNMLHELLSKNVKGNKMKENENQLNIIKNGCTAIKTQDDHGQTESYHLKENYSLYDYQKSDVNWMRRIENNVKRNNNVIQFSYTPITHVLDGRLVLYNNILLPRWLISDNVIDCKDSFRYLGGNLISEMGLGKTMICYSHIFSDLQRDNDSDCHRQKVDRLVRLKSTCNYCYKRGKKRGDMCDNELCEDSNLYCKTHTSSAFYDKRSLEIINKDLFDICDFVHEGKFRTNATLIIAPNQLCDQWTTEYLTKFENDKRVVLIVTNDQYENLRLADLLFADVVITSYQFISSLHVNRSAVDVERLKSDGAECLTDKNRLLSLHNFTWKRVILDEVHELGKIAKSKSIITFISELRSDFKWNVTGTPFANGLLSFYLLMGLNTTLRGVSAHG
jgi:SNF2 family DNA or RNA helicase